jgi:hypothetical protein
MLGRGRGFAEFRHDGFGLGTVTCVRRQSSREVRLRFRSPEDFLGYLAGFGTPGPVDDTAEHPGYRAGDVRFGLVYPRAGDAAGAVVAA